MTSEAVLSIKHLCSNSKQYWGNTLSSSSLSWSGKKAGISFCTRVEKLLTLFCHIISLVFPWAVTLLVFSVTRMFIISNVTIHKTYFTISIFDFKGKNTLTNCFIEQLEHQQVVLLFLKSAFNTHFSNSIQLQVLLCQKVKDKWNIESLKLEKTSGIIQSNYSPTMNTAH